MARAEKLLDRMRSKPRDWRIEQLQTVAVAYEVEWVHSGGSHCTFRTPKGDKLSVPAKRPIKPVYIRQFVNLIDTI